jgi:quercetin dioxygenase-like cupin family protein
MRTAHVAVQRWAANLRPEPGAIEAKMQAERVPYYRWSNAPGDVYGAHSHAYHKVIYVVQGSITFGLPQEGLKIHLSAGDRLELPPGISHDAAVGVEGVVCLEGHRQDA